jgi:hypothetical protein
MGNTSSVNHTNQNFPQEPLDNNVKGASLYFAIRFLMILMFGHDGLSSSKYCAFPTLINSNEHDNNGEQVYNMLLQMVLDVKKETVQEMTSKFQENDSIEICVEKMDKYRQLNVLDYKTLRKVEVQELWSHIIKNKQSNEVFCLLLHKKGSYSVAIVHQLNGTPFEYLLFSYVENGQQSGTPAKFQFFSTEKKFEEYLGSVASMEGEIEYCKIKQSEVDMALCNQIIKQHIRTNEELETVKTEVAALKFLIQELQDRAETRSLQVDSITRLSEKFLEELEQHRINK